MSKNYFNREVFVPIFFAFSFGMILATSLHQKNVASHDDSEYLLMYKGVDKTLKDLPRDLSMPLEQLTQEYRAKRERLLEDAAMRLYVANYAAQQEISLEEAAASAFVINEPSDIEIETFYRENQDKLAKPFFEVRDQIKSLLVTKEARRQRQRVLDQLKAQGDLLIYPLPKDSQTKN